MRFLPRLILLLASLPLTAWALNPMTPLQEYNRTSWTGKDGAPAEVRSMAQTRDGWLWMAGPFGLQRFDGMRFEQYKLPATDNPLARRAFLIRANPSGGLWISFAIGGGLSLLHPDGKLEEVVAAGKLPAALQLALDDNGDVWNASSEGLFRVRKGEVKHYGEAQGLPPKLMFDVRIDRYQRLWVVSSTGAHLYDRASDSFTQVRPLPINSTLIESPDGRIWTANNEQIKALPAPADPAAKMSAPNAVNAPGFGSDWIARFDRDGNLWRLKCPNDICLTPAHVVAATDTITAPPDAPDKLKQAPGTTPMAANVIIEDRERNIWVATMEGLDRYRDNRMQRIRLSSARATFMMTTDENGQAWVADPYNNAIWKMKAGAEPQRDPTPAWVVAKGRDGALLLPWKRDIERRLGGKVEKVALPEIPGPDGKPQDLTIMGLTDDGKRLWLVAMQTGLIIQRDGPWLPRSKYNLPPKILLGVPGKKPGETWLGCADRSIVLFDENDKLTTYPADMIGQATGIFTSHEVVATGDLGAAVLQNGRFRQLLAADPEVLQNVSGLVVAPDGDRWLNGSRGLVHVRQADWQASMAQPSLPLRYQLFGAQDGYVGKAMLESRHPSAILDKDGQLWLASTGGILRFDTRNVLRNEIPPAVSLQAVHANNAVYPVRAGMKLPAGAQNFNISYSAISLRQPEALRFQYRLDGTDSDWQEAGARNIATYTNMAPGA
jgi:ligand-binding sensor domain-containing protein